MNIRPAPTTAELVERYGEPDDIALDETNPSNNERAAWALAALNAFTALVYRRDDEKIVSVEDLSEDNGIAPEIIGDLIADLLVLGVMCGEDADDLVRQALSHFTAEIGVGFEQEQPA